LKPDHQYDLSEKEFEGPELEGNDYMCDVVVVVASEDKLYVRKK
jgi:hypothetical protein